uniref:Protein krueppel n=1 Tax=Mesocestoides corti TaxID=53468 RepID=A0A5K3FM42_MESCO
MEESTRLILDRNFADAEDDNQLSLCCICGKTFPAISLLHFHIDNEHNDDSDGGLSTPLSSVPVTTPCSKDPLINVITDKKPSLKHNCPVCEKVFPGQTSLKVHVETVHQGLRPQTCEICQKRFSTLSYLRLHITTVHEGVKAYSCPLCSKRYTQKHSLKKHIKSNHGTAHAAQPSKVSCASRISSKTTNIPTSIPKKLPRPEEGVPPPSDVSSSDLRSQSSDIRVLAPPESSQTITQCNA